jgi:hypothetical protein
MEHRRSSHIRHVLAVFTERTVVVVIGFVLMVVGLAMMVSFVMLPAGVVVGLIGVGLLITGLFYIPTPKQS